MTEGILLVDKPAGWTSFDVVNKVRRLVADDEDKKPKNIKVGHTGTLDPFATGLLVVLIGKNYTKKAEQLSSDDKTYQFTVIMGKESTTGDPEGEITDCAVDVSVVTEEMVRKSFKGWVGDVYQRPSAFSAIKINGKRAYELARKGEEVEMPLRKVEVKRLTLDTFDNPAFSATVEVIKGTYIRTLAEDICKDLGFCGYTTALRRTKAGKFDVKDAITISKETTVEQVKEVLFTL